MDFQADAMIDSPICWIQAESEGYRIPHNNNRSELQDSRQMANEIDAHRYTWSTNVPICENTFRALYKLNHNN